MTTKFKLKKLPRSFYLRPTLTVAKDLLGKLFVRRVRNKFIIGKVVEVEAYCEGDPASHSYRGKTKRNSVMFWEGGHLYVYFTYGMHFCANVVTEQEGIGEAVLIRSVEPIEGIEIMKKNRGLKANETVERTLTNGPAKLCKAFGITRKHNGVDLLNDEIFLAEGKKIPTRSVGTSTRIGIKKGTEKTWRFYLKESPFVTKQ